MLISKTDYPADGVFRRYSSSKEMLVIVEIAR